MIKKFFIDLPTIFSQINGKSLLQICHKEFYGKFSILILIVYRVWTKDLYIKLIRHVYLFVQIIEQEHLSVLEQEHLQFLVVL